MNVCAGTAPAPRAVGLLSPNRNAPKNDVDDLQSAFQQMAVVVAVTDRRLGERRRNIFNTLPWWLERHTRSKPFPSDRYWRTKTPSGRCLQVARQIIKLKSLADTGVTDVPGGKSIRSAARIVSAEVETFLRERDTKRPARYATDISDLELVTAKIDGESTLGIKLDRARTTIHGRYNKALGAIEKQFGEFCTLSNEKCVETEQSRSRRWYNRIIFTDDAWIRELWPQPQATKGGVKAKSKAELRAEAEILVAEYLERGGNYPGLPAILKLPPGRAYGYESHHIGCAYPSAGLPGRLYWYYPITACPSFIIEKRLPSAWSHPWPPIEKWTEASYWRGLHHWESKPIAKRKWAPRSYYGPVVAGTCHPRDAGSKQRSRRIRDTLNQMQTVEEMRSREMFGDQSEPEFNVREQ